MIEAEAYSLLSQPVEASRMPQTLPNHVNLPVFRSEVDDAVKRVVYVNKIKNEYKISDISILVRRFLHDSLKIWYER